MNSTTRSQFGLLGLIEAVLWAAIGCALLRFGPILAVPFFGMAVGCLVRNRLDFATIGFLAGFFYWLSFTSH